jgi:hypothetical protein
MSHIVLTSCIPDFLGGELCLRVDFAAAVHLHEPGFLFSLRPPSANKNESNEKKMDKTNFESTLPTTLEVRGAIGVRVEVSGVRIVLGARESVGSLGTQRRGQGSADRHRRQSRSQMPKRQVLDLDSAALPISRARRWFGMRAMWTSKSTCRQSPSHIYTMLQSLNQKLKTLLECKMLS